MTETTRLSKRLIELTGCSRREAELYIEGGWVSVDGKIVEQPHFKVEGQPVVLLPGAEASALPPASLLVHQTADSSVPISLDNRWADDPSGIRALAGHLRKLESALELYPSASGMLVLSQDWRTLRKLREDAHKLEQEYLLEVAGRTEATNLAPLAKGFNHQGQFCPAKLSWQNENRLRLAIKQPAAGAIEALCKNLKLDLLSIRRIRIGGLSMGKLPSGQWRYLSPKDRV